MNRGETRSPVSMEKVRNERLEASSSPTNDEAHEAEVGA
jgi:hypothetical protein